MRDIVWRLEFDKRSQGITDNLTQQASDGTI
jgi:hypothetical protein